MRLLAAIILIALMWSSDACAIEPEEQLNNPAQEARARALSRELRCMVCEDESIDASQADLAADLRKLVRERIVAGDTDDEIREELRERYGDYILFRPRFTARNMLLWIGPFVLLVIAGAALLWRARATRPQPLAPLSIDEERELKAVIEEDDHHTGRADTDHSK